MRRRGKFSGGYAKRPTVFLETARSRDDYSIVKGDLIWYDGEPWIVLSIRDTRNGDKLELSPDYCGVRRNTFVLARNVVVKPEVTR